MSTGEMHRGDDTTQAELGFGKGGVPWLLLLFYLSFLTFFVWYVLEYQLPDYLEQGSGGSAIEAGAADGSGANGDR